MSFEILLVPAEPLCNWQLVFLTSSVRAAGIFAETLHLLSVASAITCRTIVLPVLLSLIVLMIGIMSSICNHFLKFDSSSRRSRKRMEGEAVVMVLLVLVVLLLINRNGSCTAGSTADS